MNHSLPERINDAIGHLREHLHREKTGAFWAGRLSDSALATATAVSAFSVNQSDSELVTSGIAWLLADQNPDGGWGDTPDSPSNISTTLLTRAALKLSRLELPDEAIAKADYYIEHEIGAVDDSGRTARLLAIYAGDKTFAVPILCNLALAGLAKWSEIPSLPFELALAPRGIMKALRLEVVSYALPALIAIGRLIFIKQEGNRSPLHFHRKFLLAPPLKLLETIQPESGGFLEAVPLTAFVAMSMVASNDADYPVTKKCFGFLRQSIRENGAWPIDMDLSTWVTTSAATAMSESGDRPGPETTEWILSQQKTARHSYTNAAPGGWGWTWRSGGVPDGDDTSGALVALKKSGEEIPDEPVVAGINWLLDLQNSDGGWPTFCRGWGKLPFDRSSPDITAHALKAFALWRDIPVERVVRAISNGLEYLRHVQENDGSWHPLWFGNQHTPDLSNPVYGTGRVLEALASVEETHGGNLVKRGAEFLLNSQNPDSGWGGNLGVRSTLEETATAVCGLCSARDKQERHVAAIITGAEFITKTLAESFPPPPSPVGLYFAKLWYGEELYPVIWSLSALSKVKQLLDGGTLH